MTAQLTHKGTRTRTTGPAATAGHGRLRRACHRVRLAVGEMNYASRRLVERQAPWAVDRDWHRG
jgi:hypothetical protein